MNEKSSVFCARYQKEMPALGKAPLVGPIGSLVRAQVCAEAWDEWVEAQMKIINEERLDLSEPRAQSHLFEKMVNFLGIASFIEQ